MGSFVTVLHSAQKEFLREHSTPTAAPASRMLTGSHRSPQMSQEKQDIDKTNQSFPRHSLSEEGRNEKTVTSEPKQYLVFADLMPGTYNVSFHLYSNN